MAGQYKYLNRNQHAKAFANDSLFASANPMEKKSLERQGLRKFISDFGVLDRLVCYGSKEKTSKGTNLIKEVHKNGIY